MRILLISDIHGNEPALAEVLKTEADTVDQIWCLGDVIGYGPHPNECCDRLRDANATVLSGNHDLAIIDKLDYSNFNRIATMAVEWSKKQLTETNRKWLSTLPSRRKMSGYTLVHASPRNPIREYVFLPEIAKENFEYYDTNVCFMGHTHIPVLFEQTAEGHTEFSLPIYNGEPISLTNRRLMINPGSVGQPRNRTPKAAYGILDTKKEEWLFKNLEYDVEKTQADMQKFELPDALIARLGLGY